MADQFGVTERWAGDSFAQFTSSGGTIEVSSLPMWEEFGAATFFATEILLWETGASVSAISEVVVNEEPLDWINRLPVPRPTPEINFSWSPLENSLTYVFGGEIFTTLAPQTRTGIPITFTAWTRFPDFHRWWAVWFFWDFGDGTSGWGPVVSHTYSVANPYAEATLAVGDNYQQVWTVSHRLLLRELSEIRVAPNIVIETN